MKPSPHKKKYYVISKAVDKIADQDERHWQFNILRKEDPVEFAVRIPDIHINLGIQSDHASEKYIAKEPAEKSENKTRALSSDKTEGCRQYNHQVWNDSSKCDSLKDRGLEDKAQDYQYP